jgi:tetratricopeptide (TPR) repeat protein
VSGLQRRTALQGLAAAAGALALGGCASDFAPQAAALRQAAAGLPRRVDLAQVPFHPQTPYHCAPAALATVLQHQGVQVTPEQLVAQVFIPARQGSLALEVAVAARRQGQVATPLAPRLAALLQEVAAGHPVLLLQNLAFSWWPQWHYAVLVGYDLDEGEVWLRSGAERRQALRLATLEHTWQRAGGWALTVLPPGTLNAGDDEARAVQAGVDFDRVAPPAAAALHYRALLARWPASLGAALGLGHALARSGALPEAAEVLQKAAQTHDHAAAWNNLAMARWELQQPEAARAALREARRCVAAGQPAWAGAVQATAVLLGEP